MPIKHGGKLASRASTWPRDHFCRTTIAPRGSRPTTWNEFLPMSMPIVATIGVDLLDMAVLLRYPVQRPYAGSVGSTAGPFHYRKPSVHGNSRACGIRQQLARG